MIKSRAKSSKGFGPPQFQNRSSSDSVCALKTWPSLLEDKISIGKKNWGLLRNQSKENAIVIAIRRPQLRKKGTAGGILNREKSGALISGEGIYSKNSPGYRIKWTKLEKNRFPWTGGGGVFSARERKINITASNSVGEPPLITGERKGRPSSFGERGSGKPIA